MKKIQDLKGRPLLLFVNAWSVGMVLDRTKVWYCRSSAGNRACVGAGRQKTSAGGMHRKEQNMAVVTIENFEDEVLAAKVPVIRISGQSGADRVKCSRRYLRRCPRSCRKGAKFGSVNVDEQAALALKYQVMSIPMLVVMQYGFKKERGKVKENS